ncbi:MULTISPECIES: toxin glutamine deamidase domain-containing protein [unclassified Streptomyces]|uniref:toxin glutamine deamidase domain-containing protein n=2 Tax=Streptomyces TaxID=1883 RepID=UPI002DDC7D1F|nr:toxin glutamine deamidase domain-containing protein [Streptomyces sp. NBC_01795]WSA91733.1 toxin glutamine deamidase domain-containing protein [Streptomyces sp. NBC_01795]WSS44464.1 toxin glutamine deamidase domain-containing protein [Streptomyces sp. NBC_01187]
MGASAIELTHFAGGVIKGGAGILNFARGLNPMDIYNLTHPAAYAQNVNMTLAGLVSTAAHPERVPQGLLKTFKNDFSEGTGRLLPELLGTKGLGTARTGLRVAAKEGAGATRYGAAAGKEGAESAAKTGAKEAGKDWSDLAKPTDRVAEKSIHADSVEPGRAQDFLDDQFPWMRDLNNRWEPGYTHNCPNNVVTVDRRLDGHEVSAAPLHGGGDMPNTALRSGHPDGFKYYMNSYDDIVKDMSQRGPDARGAISIRREDGTGHLFNVINTPHGVTFLDGQTGTLARLEQDVIRIGYMPYR